MTAASQSKNIFDSIQITIISHKLKIHSHTILSKPFWSHIR